MDQMSVFEISFTSFNLFSFVLGMLFSTTLWRAKALHYIVLYFACLALYFFIV